MATDHISREAASDLLAMALIDEWEPEYAQDRLSEIPAADVVEVVRCKDCIDSVDGFYCKNGNFSGKTFPNNFCSEGERRAGNDER